jgi:hypothetical protein
MAKEMAGTGNSSDSIIGGGLAGLLAGTVFGGPIGALVGLGTGLLSERMRRNDMDILAEDYNGIQEYSSGILQRMNASRDYVNTYGDPSGSDQEQFDNIYKDVEAASKLAQHYDATLRQSGLAQLTNAGARLDAFHNDLEARTQGLADASEAASQKEMDYLQGEMGGTQNKVREVNDLVNRAQILVNADRNIEKPETKSILMQVMGMTVRDANQDADNVSIGAFGGGYSFDVNKFNPSYSDAIKMIESVRQTTLKSGIEYMGQISQLAEKRGYTFTQSDDGTIRAHSINSVVQQFRQSQAVPGDGPPAPSLGDTATSIADSILHPMQGKASGELDAMGNLIDKGVQRVEQFGRDSVEAGKLWLNRINLRNSHNAKRPTNK